MQTDKIELDKPQTMTVIEYTGTIESYNLLVENLQLDREELQVQFVDEKHNWTNFFTGWFIILSLKRKRSELAGMSYKPGDHYYIPFQDSKK